MTNQTDMTFQLPAGSSKHLHQALMALWAAGRIHASPHALERALRHIERHNATCGGAEALNRKFDKDLHRCMVSTFTPKLGEVISEILHADANVRECRAGAAIKKMLKNGRNYRARRREQKSCI